MLAPPTGFKSLLRPLPPGVTITPRLAGSPDIIVAFVKSVTVLEGGFARWKRALPAAGALWVCWPKKSSGLKTDLDENVIRDLCLANGLVDVKVCAIDATWSGLKCVYRLADRARVKKPRVLRARGSGIDR